MSYESSKRFAGPTPACQRECIFTFIPRELNYLRLELTALGPVWLPMLPSIILSLLLFQ